jgi:hypothetical protein
MEHQESLYFTPPITIKKIDIFRDGGSIGVELIDSMETRFVFGVDGRLGSDTLDRIYVNAYHPSMNGAKLIPQGGKEEQKIIEVLQDHLDNNFSKEDQARLRNAYGKQNLNEAEQIAALSMSVIDRTRNPRWKWVWGSNE